MSRNSLGRARSVLSLLVLAGASMVAVTLSPAASAATVANPWVVSVGDSYISGEAGRWAGNANNSAETDALGPTAYDDAGSSEAIPGCHRSKSAEIYIGAAQGENLACSGAASATQPYSSGSDFKPGLDFYNDGAGHIGQALALQQFAAGHNVTAVAVSIGGNDFNFASIVQSCVEDFLTSPTWWKNYCNDDSSVKSRFHVQLRGSSDGQDQAGLAEHSHRDERRRLHSLELFGDRPDLSVSPARRFGNPLLRERLHAADHRWLRLLEQRRELGQRHRAADDQQRGSDRVDAERSDRSEDHGRIEPLRRPPVVREH
jgi:hypothetical protein